MFVKKTISFILLILFSQIFLDNILVKAQEVNSTTQINNNNTEGNKIIDSKKAFNMTIDEMDTMMFCTVIVQEFMKNHEKKIKEIEKKLNVSYKFASEKISTDIFEKCNKNIDIKNVNYYIKNLTFLNTFKWEKHFDELSKIDFNKYKNETDLEYTMDQHILMYKF